MALEEVTPTFHRRVLDIKNMDEKVYCFKFIPKDHQDIICILERNEKHPSYKTIRNRNKFSLIAKFPAKHAESTPLRTQLASHQDKKQFSSEDMLRNKRRKHGKIKNLSRAAGPTFVSQHTDKKRCLASRSTDRRLKKKKTPAQVAKD